MTKDGFECFDLFLEPVKELEFLGKRHNPANKMINMINMSTLVGIK